MIDVQMKGNNIVELDLKGEVTGEDYKKIKPSLEKLFNDSGRQKFLFDLFDMKKFTAGAIYEDIKFDLQHFKFIGPTAIVSDKVTAKVITKVADKLYPVKIEYFEDKDTALKWLGQQAA